MTHKNLTVVDAIDAAIERLQRRGWIQGRSGDAEGPNCLQGALWWGVADLRGREEVLDKDHAAYSAAHTAVSVSIIPSPLICGVLTSWNDAPDRTVEDVLLKLKEVRYSLEAEQEQQ